MTLPVDSPVATSGYLRAAQYLRMSTERQQYSIENQAEALQHYAAANRLLLVQTYADEGRSGLTAEGRPALKALITNVESGSPGFDVLLIYDVSRWGRFQDADEGAYYEHLCRRAGVRVVYCAEPFVNDASPMASIVKAMKRVMAGEYSRELSDKIWRGQAALVRRGYKAGGPAVFGLRRMVVDPQGVPKGVLERGECKSLQNYRVIFVPGPPEEVEAVQRMFRLFLRGWNLRRLANLLNSEGRMRPTGIPWCGDDVRRLLRCEAYLGNNLYNRRSRKLQQKEVWNPPDEWIRADGAFQPIVSRVDFEQARKILDERAELFDARRSRTELSMLDEVRAFASQSGSVSLAELDRGGLRFRGDAYRQQLGGILKLRQQLGLTGPKDHHFLVDLPARRQLRSTILDRLEKGFKDRGICVERLRTPRLIIGGELALLVYLAPCHITPKRGAMRWSVRFDRLRQADIVLCARLEPGSNTVRDFLLIDEAESPGECLTFGPEPQFDQFRLRDFDAIFSLKSRADVPLIREGGGGALFKTLRAARKPRRAHKRAINGRILVQGGSPRSKNRSGSSLRKPPLA
jgi:DNA invertase Pin-like site-specific DNA recombinase